MLGPCWFDYLGIEVAIVASQDADFQSLKTRGRLPEHHETQFIKGQDLCGRALNTLT